MGEIESNFQRQLKKDLRERYKGSYVMKNDPNDITGIPDLTILYKDKWAALEVKKNKKEAIASMENKYGKHPHQYRRIQELNAMSFASYIYPENREEVLNELDRKFGISGDTHEVLSE